MKKVVLSILCILMTISICSCTLNTSSNKGKASSEDVNLNKENVSSEGLNTNKLYGYTIDELSLKYARTLSIEEEVKIKKKKNRTIEEESVLLYSDMLLGEIGENIDLCGSFTYIYTTIFPKDCQLKNNPVPITIPIPIMVLQGFLKEDFTSEDDYIYANEKKYFSAQLKEYIVYEDDKVIVYNMGYLASGMNVSDYILDYINRIDENITPQQIDLYSEIYENLKLSKESILMSL